MACTTPLHNKLDCHQTDALTSNQVASLPDESGDLTLSSFRGRTGEGIFVLVADYPDTVSLNRLMASMCWSGPFSPAFMVLTDRWVAPTSSQAAAIFSQVSCLSAA